MYLTHYSPTSELGMVTAGGKVIWGRYAQITVRFFCSFRRADASFPLTFTSRIIAKWTAASMPYCSCEARDRQNEQQRLRQATAPVTVVRDQKRQVRTNHLHRDIDTHSDGWRRGSRPDRHFITNDLPIMHALSTEAANIDLWKRYMHQVSLSPSLSHISRKGNDKTRIPTSALQKSTLTRSIPLE